MGDGVLAPPPSSLAEGNREDSTVFYSSSRSGDNNNNQTFSETGFNNNNSFAFTLARPVLGMATCVRDVTVVHDELRNETRLSTRLLQRCLEWQQKLEAFDKAKSKSTTADEESP